MFLKVGLNLGRKKAQVKQRGKEYLLERDGELKTSQKRLKTGDPTARYAPQAWAHGCGQLMGPLTGTLWAWTSLSSPLHRERFKNQV